MDIPIPPEWKTKPAFEWQGVETLVAMSRVVEAVSNELRRAVVEGSVKPLMVYGDEGFLPSLEEGRVSFEYNAVKIQYGGRVTVFFTEEVFLDRYNSHAVTDYRDKIPQVSSGASAKRAFS